MSLRGPGKGLTQVSPHVLTNLRAAAVIIPQTIPTCLDLEVLLYLQTINDNHVVKKFARPPWGSHTQLKTSVADIVGLSFYHWAVNFLTDLICFCFRGLCCSPAYLSVLSIPRVHGPAAWYVCEGSATVFSFLQIHHCIRGNGRAGSWLLWSSTGAGV